MLLFKGFDRLRRIVSRINRNPNERDLRRRVILPFSPSVSQPATAFRLSVLSSCPIHRKNTMLSASKYAMPPGIAIIRPL